MGNNERRHSRLEYRSPVEYLTSVGFIPKMLAEIGPKSGSVSEAQAQTNMKRRDATLLALTLTRACQLTHQEGKVNLRLKIVHTYNQCGSLREAARRLSRSRNTVRKWVRRYLAEGETGLKDRSRRPHRCPRKTPAEVEERVLSLRRERGRGRRRAARSIGLSEGTVCAWEEGESLRLAQVDTKRPSRVTGFKVRTVTGFLGLRGGSANVVKWPHLEAMMDGKPPMEKLRELMKTPASFF